MSGNAASQSIHERLGSLIDETESGERLPSEPDLAKDMGVSRATLREAMRTFETRGLLRRKQGVGTFVIHPTNVFETGLENLASLKTIADQIDLEVFPGDLEIERIQADQEIAEQLNLDPGSRVVKVSRVIMTKDRPIAYLVDILPLDVLPPQELKADFKGSVLDLLIERRDPPLASSRCDINAIGATSEIARALAIQRHDPLLVFTSKLYSVRGRVIDFSHSYFLPGYFRFHIVRRIGEDI
jgi:GntR family transcriptional regulator